MPIQRADFPLPEVDHPLLAPFFDAAARGVLVVPRCDACAKFVWYPQESCPGCNATPVWTSVSGRGALFSWAVVRRPFLPAFADKVPFVSALVALVEDPAVRIVTYIVDAEPADLRAEQLMAVTFRPLTFSTVPDRSVIVPMFQPADV